MFKQSNHLYAFLLMCAGLCLLATSSMAAGHVIAHPEAMVDGQWLEKYAQDPGVVVLDASDVKDGSYEQKTVQDALCMSYRDLRQSSGLMKGVSYGLERETFQEEPLENMFQQTGVDNDSTVVVVAQYRVDDAAMVFWALKWLGHEDVRLLPVNYLKVLPESMLTSDMQQWSDEDGQGNFEAQADWSWYAGRKDVLQAMHSSKTFLWDVRSADYFQGVKTKTVRGGTLATAKNWTFKQAWTDKDMSAMDWELVDSALTSMFPVREEERDSVQIISFCNSGHSAGAGFLAWQCGYDWALCDASWNIMAYDGSLPVKNLHLYVKP